MVMAYKKLSEVVMELQHPQQSDKFVKMFRDAVREGEIDAMDLTERFSLPKQYQRRGKKETYNRQMRDMLFLETAKSKKWIDSASESLAQIATRGGRTKVKPSLESVESGAIDFAAMVEKTRSSLQAKHDRGQKLGNMRKSSKKK